MANKASLCALLIEQLLSNDPRHKSNRFYPDAESEDLFAD
ncbi:MULTISPECIES: malate:quinone oxidoreductase [unclassified Marinomonas]|nr:MULTISPECIES: malate:quinone oxidoreductase [unclassified Marinomonas]